jgi:hypothetical protein
MESFLDKVNRENVDRFGPVCEKCELFGNYCTCESFRIYQLTEEGKCHNCEEPVLSHRVCKSCRFYDGRKVL